VRALSNYSGTQRFARRQDQRDRPTHWHFITGFRRNPRENTGSRRFNLYRSFVSFDFHQRLAFGHRLTFGFEPLEQCSRLLRHAESGHDYIGRQNNLS
jgi:hypothetical protein